MTPRLKMLLLIVFAGVIGLGGRGFAGGESVGPNSIIFVPPTFGNAPKTTPPAGSVTDTQTDSVVFSLTAANRFCAALPQSAYAIDCMSERLEAVARAMPKTGDYADARTALLNASRKLHDLAVSNAAPDLPRVGMRSGGAEGIRTSRPLTAVDPAALSDVGQQAAGILAELETVLLRSGEASAERKSHYSRIAAAAGSNKVLLRSL